MEQQHCSRQGWLVRLFDPLGGTQSSQRYYYLRRNIIILIVSVSVVPLALMAAINFFMYQDSLKNQAESQVRTLINKTRHSFELFLHERLASVAFIAGAYTYDQLKDEKALNRVYHAAKKELAGFVDFGLINANGTQVSYVGPYDLKNKDYSGQDWFQQVRVRGTYISDVFMGYRGIPHVAIAVEHLDEDGARWVVRATINTDRFEELIAAMGLGSQSDAFLINRAGVMQTDSRHFGKVLEKAAITVGPGTHQPEVVESTGLNGQKIFVGHVNFGNPELTLVLVQPISVAYKAWNKLRMEMLTLFLGSTVLIVFVVWALTGVLVRRIREADDKRAAAFREVEHAHKLSSIGRLAAGVAHEINNPLAIINEKAGLMNDLMEHGNDEIIRAKFPELVASVLQSVSRCRTITHRLLGFARRMEVQVEPLDVNEIVREVLGFLEKESLYRNISLELNLDDDLPRISSDRGQLQQVFLNIINNAIAAVDNGGRVQITTRSVDLDTVAVLITDNGVGMSDEVLSHIFEPFFTTKGAEGTGLGLAITYGIVQKLGGRIAVASEEGKGSTFTIELPKRAKPQEES
ncbi:integral membrane sensor signal transduction histidine kinase [Oleidesulfovibrio alaskensis G20]|jgi:two-component system NtrC family sensor kinase|uniref:histidine kinase n=1 Tax=Oleidesulfovibrio alaskensis (strain ATCC BAA-1058 / DSM 17464 / G20) TaxID=207559 RepID=Q316M5_OLEA2|nr:PAS domain-containing sensor histidine kinase [Oleidesulfovibrio alaskensis]ABB37121.1 integral membrane sensor signal transduction histidine kinase [Oleidesulfovibrio alaskensis G20]MBG0774134.1 two-component sensor histidine kinase [Oleidesulfovibrio alaskensis]MBL3582926.1 two-component sensor histidine kinase [Oleidesulfovibrio alaskensis]